MMLTDKERQIAERLCDNSWDTYMAGDPAKRVMFDVADTILGDGRMVAKALLREHPPDDELPFTREWFNEHLIAWKQKTGNRNGWVVTLSGFASVGEEATYHLSGTINGDPFEMFVPPNSTRGQVRQFLEWQGIVLK